MTTIDRADETGRARATVDALIEATGGWRAETLAEARRLVRAADPEIVEECKWVKPSNPLGVAAWSCDGLICTGEVYKQTVKLTFARGAALADPTGLFNASLTGNTRRAIDLREGDTLDASAFTALVRAAIEENRRARSARDPKRARASDAP